MANIKTASVHADLHSDRVFIAIRSKKNTWTRLSLDFKTGKPYWQRKRISRQEAIQWVDAQSKLGRQEFETQHVSEIG